MKKMIALLLAAMLLLSLAACASTADPAPAADAAPAETAETTSAAEEAPAAETDAEAPITLSYWLPCNDLEDGAAEQKGVIATARAFMEKYPNITLDLVPIGGNSDDYNAKFQMGASANNLPDLMNTSYGWVKQWAGTGVIMQLDDIVAEIGSNYKTDALDFANEAVDGYWAIPYMAEVQGWAYNTEILGKYGLEVPTTFDEFINVCNVLTENGERAISHGATDIWAIWGYHALFCQYGVDKALCEKLSASRKSPRPAHTVTPSPTPPMQRPRRPSSTATPPCTASLPPSSPSSTLPSTRTSSSSTSARSSPIPSTIRPSACVPTAGTAMSAPAWKMIRPSSRPSSSG